MSIQKQRDEIRETLTFEYECCGECPYVASGMSKWYCERMDMKRIPDLWNEPIPSWCPLEDKPEKQRGNK